MSEYLQKVSNDYWNIRGDFKIGGVLNIGTHASLVRCLNSKFVLLDAYTLQGDVKEQVDRLSQGGADIDAIINLHPFHTVHVERAHEQYPHTKLYGTQRHHDKFPHLPWQTELTESDAFARLFADDFEFSIPAGVDFIASNEQLHFSSVLAYHKASKTIHVDDTLTYMPLPGLLGKVKKPEVTFHITLPATLQRRAGAAQEFRDWAEQLASRWADAENLCAAHSAVILGSENSSISVADRILLALKKVKNTLKVHEKIFG
ncbi:MAG: hypothetical protein HRU20_19200 [Pseudomonadales bacterium]|nr:hypothetical protein [Pseudomonadales bacterium]